MSHAEKSRLYQELKGAGVSFDKPYRQYTTDELRVAVNKLRELNGQPSVEHEQQAQEPLPVAGVVDFQDLELSEPEHANQFQQAGLSQPPSVQLADRAPDTDAGIRQNAADLRVDEDGLVWYQDEIRKPAYPKPRARRVLRYMNPGTETRTVVNGSFLESFEVAGQGAQQGEIKITLPSYQVGIYKDPRFPFKIHVYNEVRGFDLFEVQEFYGGAELVPEECKRMYVENVLCYDIRTVIRAIETEARQLALAEQRGL